MDEHMKQRLSYAAVACNVVVIGFVVVAYVALNWGAPRWTDPSWGLLGLAVVTGLVAGGATFGLMGMQK